MDEWGIKNYAGQIEVVEKSSSLGEVIVRVAGKEALQAVGGILTSLRVDETFYQNLWDKNILA